MINDADDAAAAVECLNEDVWKIYLFENVSGYYIVRSARTDHYK